MTNLSFEIIRALEGKTLSTAESCTGGLIGAALTAVPGSSRVYKGGVVSYTNEIKQKLLGVPEEILSREGAVSAAVAMYMAAGAKQNLDTDFAVSVTGLAGPGGDEYGNPVGTVYIGFSGVKGEKFRKFCFLGDRDEVRRQAAVAAMEFILDMIKE